MGMVPWTIDLQKAGRALTLWQDVYKNKIGKKKDNVRRTLRLAKKAAIVLPEVRTITAEDASKALQQAQQQYDTVKNNNKKSSGKGTHRQAVALARSERMGTSMEQEEKNLEHRDKIKQDHKLVRSAFGSAKQALTRVTITGEDGPVELTAKEDVENACLDSTMTKYTVAHNAAIYSVLPTNSTATDDVAQAILRGEPPTVNDEYVQQYINSCVQVVPTFQFPCDTESHSNSWRAMNENTASGYSGVNFAHFIANTYDEDTAEVDALLSYLPFAFGFAPKRWKTSVDVMLLKKVGVTDVKKLRTINLMEADFNHGNKRLARLMMDGAERYGLLASAQHGSRKRKTAIAHSVSKRLTQDCMRAQKIDGALCSNDATGCYDRIIHVAASLAMQQAGVPASACECMFSCLQNMTHYVSTAYGISESSRSPSTQLPIHGVGQGNGAGPAIWALMSSRFYHNLELQNVQATFTAPLSGKQYKTCGLGFVDDAENMVTADTAEQVAPALQRNVDVWSGNLRATGGELEPTKTTIQAFRHHCQDGKWKLMKTPMTPVYMKNSQGQNVEIQVREMKEGLSSLGVHQAPDGNTRDQFEYSLDKSRVWRSKMRGARSQRHIVQLALRTTITRTLQYAGPATTLTEAQCRQIEGPAVNAALSAAGINRHIPKVVVHGPLALNGLNIQSLFYKQGIARIKVMMENATQDTMIGHMLRTLSETMKLESGLFGPVLLQSYSKFHTA